MWTGSPAASSPIAHLAWYRPMRPSAATATAKSLQSPTPPPLHGSPYRIGTDATTCGSSRWYLTRFFNDLKIETGSGAGSCARMDLKITWLRGSAILRRTCARIVRRRRLTALFCFLSLLKVRLRDVR